MLLICIFPGSLLGGQGSKGHTAGEGKDSE